MGNSGSSKLEHRRYAVAGNPDRQKRITAEVIKEITTAPALPAQRDTRSFPGADVTTPRCAVTGDRLLVIAEKRQTRSSPRTRERKEKQVVASTTVAPRRPAFGQPLRHGFPLHSTDVAQSGDFASRRGGHKEVEEVADGNISTKGRRNATARALGTTERDTSFGARRFSTFI